MLRRLQKAKAVNILVLQHLRVEHSGVFGDLWREAGHREHVIELDEGQPIPSLDGFDLLAVMGGPMDVWQETEHPWLVAEKAAIRRWVVKMQRPYLGICLGHQLLADALGGKVGLMAGPEVGLATVALSAEGRRDPVLAGLADEIETLQWHGAEVARLPDGAIALAANAHCPVQALRAGRHAYGFQFHMEITERTVGDWRRIPEYARSLEQALGPGAADRLAEAVTKQLPAFMKTARHINDRLLTLARR